MSMSAEEASFTAERLRWAETHRDDEHTLAAMRGEDVTAKEVALAILERAVIEAAIEWRGKFNDPVADDLTERVALAQAVDALIAAREKQ